MILNKKYSLCLEQWDNMISVSLSCSGKSLPIFNFTSDGKFEETEGSGSDFVSDFFITDECGRVLCDVDGKGKNVVLLSEEPEYLMLTNEIGLGLFRLGNSSILSLVGSDGVELDGGDLLQFWSDGRIDRIPKVCVKFFPLNTRGQLKVNSDSMNIEDLRAALKNIDSLGNKIKVMKELMRGGPLERLENELKTAMTNLGVSDDSE